MRACSFLIIIIAVISLLLSWGSAIAGGMDDPNTVTSVPRSMSYQGILKDAGGNPVTDSTYDVTFRIFDVATGGSSLWSQTLPCATSAGYFDATLNNVNLPFDEDYWLELEIDSEVLDPRQKINMVGYAARADTSDYALNSAGGGSNWMVSADVIYTNDAWGIAKGEVDNMLHGANDETMINLGVACTTGAAGQSYSYLTVGGGYQNVASNDYSTVGGGVGNHATGGVSTVAGGGSNDATGGSSAIGGGWDNMANDVYATVAGGRWNHATGHTSAVGGGQSNKAEDYVATVSGGKDNVASGSRATVGGGEADTASGNYSTIGGGRENYASGSNSTVAGGYHVAATAWASTVGGGSGNTASGTASTVAGGIDNTAGGMNSVVGGGDNNAANGWASFIGSGYENTSGDSEDDSVTVVAGGFQSAALGKFAAVLGGYVDTASGNYSVVCGGSTNRAITGYCSIGGGFHNLADSGMSTIGGGWFNTASGYHSTIGGGLYNTTREWGCTVGGGGYNNAIGPYCGIASGDNNYCGTLSSNEDTASFIGGGRSNFIHSKFAVICGGSDNKIDPDFTASNGIYSVIGGGEDNTITSDYSVIPGGQSNTLISTADYSMAFGQGVYVTPPYRVYLFNGTNDGRLGLNRDSYDGGAAYPIHVGTSTSNGNGAYLTNGGTWTNGSSRNFKENFRSLGANELINKISKLEIASWNYKDSDEKHIGPVAEDFVAAFDVGTIRESDGGREDHYLAASDVAGVALAGVQALLDRIEKLEARIAELEAERK